jgi:multidrug efflux pump subunit AcrA (membrane-fusion protein)
MTRTYRKLVARTGVVAALLGAAVGVALVAGRPRQPVETSPARAAPPETDPDAGKAVAVNCIHPKRDPSFVISIEEPAYVDAYYRANLEARVAGPVKFIRKDIGDPVAKGERLIEIDVPDLLQEVAQKESIVDQRRQEQELAQAQVKMAQAAVDVAREVVKEKEAEVKVSEADRIFREKELKRFRELAAERGVTQDIVEEREKFYQSALAAEARDQVAVLKAKSDLQEVEAKLEAAGVDVKLKEALVAVARKDRDRVQALADYAKITAPFRGVIVKRNVDPGSFVQNATTAHTEPLLTLERTDIVTVHMNVPDNYAPFVTRNTDAIIEMAELPGQLIHGKVTRFSPSLRENDRTMRVEVDLYNGTQEDYRRGEAVKWEGDLKGEARPLFPTVTGKNAGQPHPLLPGMLGRMRLVLHSLRNAYLVPSNIIMSQGGKPYIYVVKNGAAHLVPVDVQVDDGKLAKIAVITKIKDEEVKQDLTGDELIVASNQGELSDGQAVQATPVDW